MLQTRCAAGNRGGFFYWDTATGMLYWVIDKLDSPLCQATSRLAHLA